jgi:hypothetical protein
MDYSHEYDEKNMSTVCTSIKHGVRLSLIVVVQIAIVLFAGSLNAESGKPKPISFWETSDESSVKQVDHSAWQDILTAYLRTHSSGINKFDYAALKGNAKDTSKLVRYLNYLQELDPRTYPRAEQKAYWINLYNSLTIKLVVDAYPVDSIRDICRNRVSGSKCSGPWGEVNAKIAGQELTLDNIENDILRPIWKDDLIHYGLSCASYGCPDLLETSFTAKNTETLLDIGARRYVNHSRGVDFMEDDFIVISSIYNWYVEDFGNNEQSVIKHLARYADKELAKRLKNFNGTVNYEYDWRLNRP